MFLIRIRYCTLCRHGHGELLVSGSIYIGCAHGQRGYCQIGYGYGRCFIFTVQPFLTINIVEYKFDCVGSSFVDRCLKLGGYSLAVVMVLQRETACWSPSQN